MNNSKTRIKIITILSMIVAVFSLGIGYSAYNINNEESGIATVIKDIYDIKIDNINSELTSNENITFKEKPVSTYNEVFFSVANLIHENNISYKFDIINSGNIDIEIENIELKGIDNYKDNITFKIDNLKIGDIIKGEEQVKDNTFTLTYTNPIYDKYNNLMVVDLDNLKLIITFKPVK